MLTLHECLDRVNALGPEYAVTDRGIDWTAEGLLSSLSHNLPDDLNLAVYLRLPDTQQDGAICQVTQSGGYILRYRIKHLPPPSVH